MTAPTTEPVITGNVLPSVTALHVLLAQHPHLAALPLAWSIDATHGIHAVCREHLDPGTARIAETIAAALGRTVGRSEFTSSRNGLRKACLYIDGEVTGIALTFNGYVLLDEDGGERCG